MNVNKFYQSLKRCYENSDLYLKLLDHNGKELACISNIHSRTCGNKSKIMEEFTVEPDHDYKDENGKWHKAYMIWHEYSGFRVIFCDFREDWI